MGDDGTQIHDYIDDVLRATKKADLGKRGEPAGRDRAQAIVVIGGPWPERIGLTGRVVPQLRNEYPWHGCPKNEVVIFIDDDPLTAHYGLDWSCAIGRKDIAPAAAVGFIEDTNKP